jgi:hypothetical protein
MVAWTLGRGRAERRLSGLSNHKQPMGCLEQSTAQNPVVFLDLQAVLCQRDVEFPVGDPKRNQIQIQEPIGQRLRVKHGLKPMGYLDKQ